MGVFAGGYYSVFYSSNFFMNKTKNFKFLFFTREFNPCNDWSAVDSIF